MNPKNLKLCPVCDSTIKDYKNAKTCSPMCGNNLFKRCGEDHWNYQNGGQKSYRNICFKHHKKICIICGEKIAVDVHHYDGNNNNNHPTNLIPLCHNHHLYLLFKDAKYIIKECVDDYHNNFLKNWKE